MIIYYSGEGSKANPEYTLGDEATVMLTFWDMHKAGNQPTKRFEEIQQVRALPPAKPAGTGDKKVRESR